MLPSCCCKKCAVHAYLQQPTSISVSQVRWFHVSASASACRKARFASSTESCRLFPVLVRVAALLIAYLHYERLRWSSCEVAVSPFLFDLPCNQSTSHFHSFTVTFVDVSPSTRDRFACCSHPAHLVISFAIVHVHTTFVELVERVQSTHLVIVAWIQRSFAGMVCMSTSLSVTLLEAPPVLTESCGAASS